MEDIAAERAAETLLAEHTANTKFKPFDPPDAPATIPDAYDIQQRYVALLRDRHGEAVGYKVGLTSDAMQKFCGIDHPIAGVVLASRVRSSGAHVARSEFGRLGLEFEIAVRIKSDVPVGDGPCTAAMIAPHIDGVCAAIELVDDRSADYTNLDVLALVADNSWNAGIVLSEFAMPWPDLEAVRGRASKDGADIGEGFGREVLAREDDHRRLGKQADEIEGGQRIEIEFLVERGNGRQADMVEQQGISVGFRFRRLHRADRTAGAADILNQHRLL